RVLQEQEITPLGSSQTKKIDVRIIAATNRNLKDEIRKGTFREDLYFRLAVLTIELPPLRERKEDIPVLANFFLERICERFGKRVNPMSNDLMVRLKAYHWPGNIRELQNAVERGVVLAKDDQLSYEDMIYHPEITEESKRHDGLM